METWTRVLHAERLLVGLLVALAWSALGLVHPVASIVTAAIGYFVGELALRHGSERVLHQRRVTRSP